MNVAQPADDWQSFFSGKAGRLWALLQLVVDEPAAARLASATANSRHPERALRQALWLGRWDRLASRIGPLLGRHPVSSDGELAPPESLSLAQARFRIRDPNAALALALHLGLNLSAARIGSITRRTPSEVGTDLEAARRAIDPTLPAPCPEYAELIGRYRDPTLPITERAKLLHHVRSCRVCGPALDGAYRVDATLTREIDAIQRKRPEQLRRARRLPSGFGAALLLLLASLILIAALVSGTVIAHRELSPSTTPVPLVISRAPASLNGWLLFATESGVQGLNIETGESRLLVNETGNQLFALLPSPDNSKFAIVSPQAPVFLEVDDLNYHTVRTWERGANDPRMSPVGWLGPNHILAQIIPTDSPKQTKNVPTPSLVALNLATGASQTLYTGTIDPNGQVTGSPDGTLVAIMTPSTTSPDRDLLQLFPVGPNGLGAPLFSLTRASISNLAWSPNSQSLYFAASQPGGASPAGTPNGATGAAGASSQEIVALGRDGSQRIVAPVPAGETVTRIDVSPGGDQIAYVLSRGSGNAAEQSLWRYDSQHQSTGQILPWSRSDIGRSVWTPDDSSSTMLVYENRLFYLPVDATDPAQSSRPPLQVPVLVRVAFNGDHQVISNVLGGFDSSLYNAGLLAWLPGNAVNSVQEPQPSPVPIVGDVEGSAPVPAIPSGTSLYPTSTLSPDGRFLVMQSGEESRVVWDTFSSSGRLVPTPFSDPSWLPSGQGILAVDNTPNGSRLTIVASVQPSDLSSPLGKADGDQFDPAGIAGDRDRSYGLPLMAPDGDEVAFFVRDTRNQLMSLWLAGWETPPEVVMTWPLPDDAIAGDTPVASWIDPSTLIVGMPSNWHDGLPRRVALMRVTLNSDGADKPVQLWSAKIQGSDRGIALENLAASPDEHYLAWRLRHFGELNATRGSFDSIDVAPARDISRTVEVVRGASGDGLSWNADSYWLAAAIQGRVDLFSPDGTAVKPVSPSASKADEPCWVTPQQLWYTASTPGGARRMMQATVH